MEAWSGFFLGVIALAAVLQSVFVILGALALRQTARDVKDMQTRFDRDIRPTLDDLRSGAANFKAITQLAKGASERVDALLTTTIDSLELTLETVRDSVLKPLRGLQDLSAFITGIKRGLEAFRGAPSSAEPRPTGPRRPRRGEDASEEHLFIG